MPPQRAPASEAMQSLIAVANFKASCLGQPGRLPGGANKASAQRVRLAHAGEVHCWTPVEKGEIETVKHVNTGCDLEEETSVLGAAAHVCGGGGCAGEAVWGHATQGGWLCGCAPHCSGENECSSAALVLLALASQPAQQTDALHLLRICLL